MYHSFLIHLSADGHLGCLHFSWIRPLIVYPSSHKNEACRKGAAHTQGRSAPHQVISNEPVSCTLPGFISMTLDLFRHPNKDPEAQKGLKHAPRILRDLNPSSLPTDALL